MSRLHGDGLNQTPWGRPWYTAWGVIGRATTTGTQVGVTGAAVDVTGLTTTFVASANRLYKIEWNVTVDATVAGNAIAPVQLDGTQIATTGLDLAVGGNLRGLVGVAYTTMTAGSHTVKVRVQAGAGTIDVQGAATTPCFLIVTDVGPA